MKAMPSDQLVPSAPCRPLRVGIVVGGLAIEACPKVFCGVRDYAVCLAEALAQADVDVRVMAPPSWALRDGLAFLRRVRAERLDLLHLQYPSIGHRGSLIPHVLGLSGAARRFVVTVHEHSALPRLQRMTNALFRVTADRIMFTTEYEAKRFGAGFDDPVIPIGSNVPVHPAGLSRDHTVLYFGQVRPAKGLEAFIELARLSEAAGQALRFVVVGSAPSRWRVYHQKLRLLGPTSLDWVENAPAAFVAQSMATAMAAYLPFPDGAGFRRGTLLAALSNGLPVLAPFGPATPDALRPVLLEAATPAAALLQVQALLAEPNLGCRHGEAGRVLARQFTWPSIVAQHAAVYRSVLEIEQSAGAGGLASRTGHHRAAEDGF